MNFTALVLLAFAMSTDAFAAAIARGATMQRVTVPQALRIGMLFGLVEGTTPVIGWLVGSFAARWVENWDHWIAFSLLLVLGLRMMRAGFAGDDNSADHAPPAAQPGLAATALTALATSIDAMAVGVGLAFVNVSITEAAMLIGAATCLMVTIGVMLGRALSRAIGKRAEVAGGAVLICVGATILYQHLSA